MKKFNLLVLVLVFISLGLTAMKAQAQDFIIKKDKKEIKSKVMEITEDVIKYKKFETPDGPTYSIRKSEVTMIVYNNGRKEYMDDSANQNATAAITPSADNSSTNTDDEMAKRERSFVSLAVNDSGNSYDLEGWLALSRNASNTGKLYLGASVYSTFASPNNGGVYPFLGYKLALDGQKNFNIWGNGGYNIGITASYYIGSTHVPSSTSGSFLWEAGADFFFSGNFGITAYTSQGTSGWFGIIIR